MDEVLNRIVVSAEAKGEALRRFGEQMKTWGLVMPNIEPLVLHFGLGDFEKTGLIEYWIANEIEAGYCGKFLFVFDGQRCPQHSHREKVETFFIVKGRVKMRFEEREFEMAEGDTLLVEVGQKHSFVGIGAALLLELSKPCIIDDNYFEDRKIPLGGNYGGESEF